MDLKVYKPLSCSIAITKTKSPKKFSNTSKNVSPNPENPKTETYSSTISVSNNFSMSSSATLTISNEKFNFY